jgi:hypothetical protein
LALEGPQFGNAALAHLRGMSDLGRLWLEGTRVDEAGFEQLEGLAKIQSLNFFSKTADRNDFLLFSSSSRAGRCLPDRQANPRLHRPTACPEPRLKAHSRLHK